MNHKAAETTRNINAFGPGTVNKRIVQWWFKKFCKGDKNLENESSGLPLEVDNWEVHWSWFCLKIYDSVKTIWKVAEELHIDHSMVIWHLEQVGKVKKLNKWVPQELTENQKNHLFEVSSSLTTTNHFSIRLWLVAKSYDQLNGWTNKKLQSTSQSQTCTQKKGHGPCLVVCCLSEPLQLSESQQNYCIWEAWSTECTKNCKTCSLHWSTKRAQFFSTMCLTAHHITTSKVERIGLQSFASSAIFTWPLANWLPLFQASQQLFAEKTLPKQAGCRKCFPRVHWIPKRGFLCYRNKQTYFSLAKVCWL